MSTISIHDLDADVEKKLRELARERRQSLNKTIKEVLEQDLGGGSRRHRNAGRFARFRGRWTEKDYKEFAASTRDLRKVDPRDWS